MTPCTTLAPNAPWPYHDHAAWTPKPDAPEPLSPEERRRQVIDLLMGGTPTLSQIVAATGGTASGTSKLMHRLIDKGQVIRAKTPGGVTAPYVYTWRQIA